MKSILEEITVKRHTYNTIKIFKKSSDKMSGTCQLWEK